MPKKPRSLPAGKPAAISPTDPHAHSGSEDPNTESHLYVLDAMFERLREAPVADRIAAARAVIKNLRPLLADLRVDILLDTAEKEFKMLCDKLQDPLQAKMLISQVGIAAIETKILAAGQIASLNAQKAKD